MIYLTEFNIIIVNFKVNVNHFLNTFTIIPVNPAIIMTANMDKLIAMKACSTYVNNSDIVGITLPTRY